MPAITDSGLPPERGHPRWRAFGRRVAVAVVLPFYVAWESVKAAGRGAGNALAWCLVLADRALDALEAVFRWLLWPIRWLVLSLGPVAWATFRAALRAFPLVWRASWLLLRWAAVCLRRVLSPLLKRLGGVLTLLAAGFERIAARLARALDAVMRWLSALVQRVLAPLRILWRLVRVLVTGALRVFRTLFQLVDAAVQRLWLLAWAAFVPVGRAIRRAGRLLVRMFAALRRAIGWLEGRVVRFIGAARVVMATVRQLWASLAAALVPLARALGRLVRLVGELARAIQAAAGRFIGAVTDRIRAFVTTLARAARMSSALVFGWWQAARGVSGALVRPARFLWRLACFAARAGRRVWRRTAAAAARASAAARAAAEGIRAEVRRILRRE